MNLCDFRRILIASKLYFDNNLSMEEMAKLMNDFGSEQEEVHHLPNVFEILENDVSNAPWPQLPAPSDVKCYEPVSAVAVVGSMCQPLHDLNFDRKDSCDEETKLSAHSPGLPPSQSDSGDDAVEVIKHIVGVCDIRVSAVRKH